jgi:hypothetical protein
MTRPTLGSGVYEPMLDAEDCQTIIAALETQIVNSAASMRAVVHPLVNRRTRDSVTETARQNIVKHEKALQMILVAVGNSLASDRDSDTGQLAPQNEGDDE